MVDFFRHVELLDDVQQNVGPKKFLQQMSNKPNRFSLIRHDVEFSPRRALRLAEIDSDLSVSSTFFFQVRNNAYNILSNENIDILNRIKNLGMDIGLHFYVSHIKEGDNQVLKKNLNFKNSVSANA